jgi:hypothetical protein
MPASYACRNPGRLERLRGQTAFNAIDHLVVVDGPAVPDGLRQRVLLVKLLLAAGVGALGPDQVQVTGGVRVRDPAVRSAVRLADLDPSADPSLSPEERDYLAALQAETADANTWLIVMVERYGDDSLYRLLLREGTAPPAGFDPVLSEINFSFKVECSSPFDCQDGDSFPVQPEDQPPLDYLARDFASFRRLMFDRMTLIAPADTSRDPAALRTALVETLAYAGDRLAYFQDAVATEAYLGTARTRPSVRRHARLLDYAMHEGCNARAFVQLTLGEGTEVAGTSLRAGARFLTRLPSGPPALAPDEVAEALSQGPAVFEALAAPDTFAAANNAIAFHTWGDADCSLLEGATEATVVDDGGLRLAPGDYLLLEQTRSPETRLEADADPARRHVVRLATVDDPPPLNDPLFPGMKARTLTWHERDALPFPLVLTVGEQPVAVARGNLVLADHGLTVADEALAIEGWGNQRGLRATLARRGLSWTQAVPAGAADELSAAEAIHQDPRVARPSIVVHGEGEVWTPVRDLLGSPASARALVVEMETDGRARLRFGDDAMGRRPANVDGRWPEDADAFRATYRIGNGPEGNLGAEAVGHLVADPAFVDGALSAAVTAVRNPLPTQGGQDEERIDEVKRYAPHAFRVQQRAVTEADWVEVAQRHPAVQRAVARLRWTGSWQTVYVTVDPVAGTTFEELGPELGDWLEPFRLAGYDLEIAAPVYLPLDIVVTVCVDGDHFREDVAEVLYQEFSTGPLPDGRQGFFHPDRFTFGDSVWLSQVVARCMAVPGVAWVDTTPAPAGNRFKRWGAPQGPEVEEGRIRPGDLEIVRCDNDRNAPEHGRIAFTMEGGA